MIKNSLLFFLQIIFEIMFNKHSPSEICRILNKPPERILTIINGLIHSRALQCSVCESGLLSMRHRSFELSDSQTHVLHNFSCVHTLHFKTIE